MKKQSRELFQSVVSECKGFDLKPIDDTYNVETFRHLKRYLLLR